MIEMTEIIYKKDGILFFTFRLGDSLPKERREELISQREVWLKTHPQPWDEMTEKEYHQEFSHKVEEWLDNGYGSCILSNHRASDIIETTLRHDDGIKYELIDYVIMPNHVHALVRMIGETSVEGLMQEWKSVSSHKIKKVLGGQWCGWMGNYFDRIIRNEDHFKNVVAYIYKNYDHGGVKIGGAVYPDSTARGRAHSQLNWHRDVIIKQLISYIVGCYMGRYRLDKPGLAIAHPNPTDDELADYTFSILQNETFTIDSDAIIPLLPLNAPFYDNLYNYVSEFIKKVWEEKDHNENMNFIERCLGKPLNDYLLKDFWKDHKKMYQNRPIYWLFSSKKGAFKAIVYVHRMHPYTMEQVRSRYLLKYMDWLRGEISKLEQREADLSTQERRSLDRLRSDLAECDEYHERLQVVAEQAIAFDLDDGIPHNHALFGDILVKLK